MRNQFKIQIEEATEKKINNFLTYHETMTVFQVKRSMWESPCTSYPSAHSPKLKWYFYWVYL